MFNCDHCQKKYKRSWHQARHSQMKHENSNASTATTSSAGTPPTPEINGNVSSINNNYSYPQQLQQVPQMPLANDLNQLQPNHQQNVAIPQTSNQWDHMQQQPPPQHQEIYAVPPEDIHNQNVQQSMPPQTNEAVNNGEYANYAVNEQYSNKFEQTHPPSTANPMPYDSWVSYRIFSLIESLFINLLSESSTGCISLGLQSAATAAATSYANLVSAPATSSTYRVVLRSQSPSTAAPCDVQRRVQ